MANPTGCDTGRGDELPSLGLTLQFLREFGLGLWMTSPLLLSLAVLIAALGQIAGRRERWPPFDSLYWSFVTATTVGYGDIRPSQRSTRLIAIAIAFIGLTFTGILIAIAVRAGTVALEAMHAASQK